MPRKAQSNAVVSTSGGSAERVTLAKVARQAGVSVGTASMALVGNPRILPDTAKRVREVARELSYVPLRRRTSSDAGTSSGTDADQSSIVMIGIDIDYGRFPIYARLLQTVGEIVGERGYQLISRVVNTHDEALAVVEQSGLAGALLLWQDADEGRVDVAELQKKLPCVRVMGSFSPGSSVDHVTCDNRRVGQLAAEYLWQRGHRIAATLQYSQPSASLFLERGRSFVEAFEHLGGMAANYSFSGNIESQEVAKAVVSSQPRPTAVFAGDDGILSRFDLLFRHAEFIPGQDVEMIGCNNEMHRLEEIEPRPVSIDLQLATLAEQALELMLWRRDNPGMSRMQVLVEPKLPAEAMEETQVNRERLMAPRCP